MTSTLLFVDDLRDVSDVYDPACASRFKVVRDIGGAKSWIVEHGIPDFISFDHDLADDDHNTTGYALAKWIVDGVLDGNLEFPAGFKYQVHSANPVGRANIVGLLDNFLRFCLKDAMCHNCLPSDLAVVQRNKPVQTITLMSQTENTKHVANI